MLKTTANDVVERLTGRRLMKNDWNERFFARLSSLRNNTGSDLDAFARYVCANLSQSRSQVFQDLWVLFTLREHQGGFFVEFGATDGVTDSNSWLLEQRHGWRGILAEPNPRWHDLVRANRPTAMVDTRCVHTKTGATVDFLATELAAVSTIAGYGNADDYAASRKSHTRFQVPTVSLGDLLDNHDAPRVIDYLSIDTEGSEYDILAAYDFSRSIRCITAEHNHTPARAKLRALLGNRGYREVLPEASNQDSWFVHETVLQQR